MKKVIRLLLLIITLYLMPSTKVFSQTHPAVNAELVLGIPTITEKSFTGIKNAISAIDGVRVAAYCDSYKCFLIYYDTNKVHSGDEIAKVVRNLNSNYKTEIKEGAGISALINNCTRYLPTGSPR